MSTIRVSKSDNFSIISNHHLRNKNLSLKAVGLLTILLSLPDNWNANVNHLVTICRDGKKAIYSAIKELKEAGYIEHVTIRDANAKILKWEYIVYEHPIEKAVNSEEKLLSQKGQVAKVQVAKGDGIIKTKSPLRKTNSIKNDDVPAPLTPPPDPIPEVKEPSSSFSSHDLNDLMQAVKSKHRTKEVEARVTRALKDGHNLEYLRRCIGYANEKSNGSDYKAYLGKSIDHPEWHEGFDPDEHIKKLQADIDKLRERQEEQQLEQNKLRTRHEKITAMIDEVDTDALDAFIDGQELNTVDRGRFKRGKRAMLRRRFVSEFADRGRKKTS